MEPRFLVITPQPILANTWRSFWIRKSSPAPRSATPSLMAADRSQVHSPLTKLITLQSPFAMVVFLFRWKLLKAASSDQHLGADSLNKSLVAGLIGFIIVALFMILYYRLPGLVAVVAIAIYGAITFALFKMIPVTLTLSGIAGFLLSTGSALDANILIFERLKEELRSGRTLKQAIELGWKRAWPSIRDSNIATIITSVILFWFGSQFGASIVKGFALTLAIGVIVSLFTAIVVTRTLLSITTDAVKPNQYQKLFGARSSENA